MRWLSKRPELLDHLLPEYRRKDPVSFDEDNGAENLARIFLLREFARRPVALNNLETLGLVSVGYPTLEQIKEAPILDMTLAEWRYFLKATLDYVVRGQGALRLPEGWSAWSGAQWPARVLWAPTRFTARPRHATCYGQAYGKG